MIHAAAWFCSDHHGVLAPAGRSWQKPSPSLSTTGDILALVGRPLIYYGRMTTEARSCLCAASAVLQATGWRESGDPEIGLISAGFDGCLQASQEYFRDYVAGGRTLGRGNLFIYTLPTSAPSEVAIALSLTGPCLFVEDDAHPLPALILHAERMVDYGEADRMLAIWSDARAAVCMAVDGDEHRDPIFPLLAKSSWSPPQLIREFHSMVQEA